MAESEPRQEIAAPNNGTIRFVELRDLEALAPILEQGIIDSDTGLTITDEVADVLSAIQASIEGRNDRTYVVSEDSEGTVKGVMGMLPPGDGMRTFATTDNPVELVNAFVDPSERGTGAGRALVEKLETLAHGQGHTEVLVNSGPRYKDTGWAFWTRLYGNPIDVQKDLYGPGLDAPVWSKLLG